VGKVSKGAKKEGKGNRVGGGEKIKFQKKKRLGGKKTGKGVGRK
jgi:hypothetical protein